MLYCSQINNYEDFRARFGYKTGQDGNYLVNSNGVRQRKNNIPYLFWKETSIEEHKKGMSLSKSFDCGIKLNTAKDVFNLMLREVFKKTSNDICPVISFGNYEIQNYGICFDGDVNSVRYKDTNTGKIYKMKIGKFTGKALDFLIKQGAVIGWINNPTLRIFFIEELTELWKNKRLKDKTLKVVVNKDFEGIYRRARRPFDSRDFSSCMDDDQNYNFYVNHPDLFDAVSLQDDDNLIYARAILVHCKDEKGNEHKYLERIYCNKRMYKDFLFDKAKQEGVFDLYKSLEASCHEYEKVIDAKTDKQIDYTLVIPLTLKSGDYISYQDSFKWYYDRQNVAKNRPPKNSSDKEHCYNLATTNERFHT